MMQPQYAFQLVRKSISRRKRRLYACACARRVERFLTEEDGPLRLVIALSEEFADGLIEKARLDGAVKAVDGVVIKPPEIGAASHELGAWAARRDAAKAAMWAGRGNADRASTSSRVAISHSVWPEKGGGAFVKERQAQGQLLYHFLGNLSQPFQAPPSWPASVVKLAQAVYDQQPCHFALHDALLEAGHLDLAEHFKESYHPKGCFAVDAILGKS